MQTNRVHLWFSSSLMLLAIPACGLLQPGQRLLHFEIEHDGKLAFSGIRGVPDSTPVKRMWDVVGDVPFEAAGDVAPGVADSETASVAPTGEVVVRSKHVDSISVTLTGKVLIRIKHVEVVLAETAVSELKLVRAGSTSSWTLAAGEGERIGRQASGR